MVLIRLAFLNFLFLSLGFCEQELVIASPHPDFLKKEFEIGLKKFLLEKTGKQTKIRWFEIGGTNDILRYILRTRHKSGIDIFFGGGTDPFEELKKEGLLLKPKLRNEMLSRVPFKLGVFELHDRDGFWFSTNLSGFGIAYNNNISNLFPNNQPSWEDLAKEFFFLKVAIADPRKSGSARFIYEILLQNFGWEKSWLLFYRFAKNSRSMTFHSSELIKKLSFGEILMAPLVESHGQRAQRLNPSIKFTIPRDLPVFFGDGIAVLISAKNPELASIAVEYALTDFQYVLSLRVGTPKGPQKKELARMAIDPTVYNSPYIVEGLVNPFEAKVGQSFVFDFKKSSERWYEFSSLFGAIVIDLGYVFRNLPYQTIDALPPPVDETQFQRIVEERRWKEAWVRDVDLARIRIRFFDRIKVLGKS
ncbi:MAG: ABC transporter substrate-binding protein [Deltaproteobacteria bacterium]|nr:ABC transporter substrate-binding protein [Deltaproteobacteria bacterium]